MKLSKVAAVVVLASASTLTFAKSTGSGCGLGQQVWEGQSGVVAQVSAATTNGTFGNQTFGLTSGTLGCDADQKVENDRDRQIYAAANLDKLAVDAARGQGDNLAALASLMNVAEADRAAFYAFAQQNFDSVFAQGGDSVATLASFDVALLGNAALARYSRA